MQKNTMPRNLHLWLTLIPVLVLFLSLFSPVAPSVRATSDDACNDPRIYIPSYSPAPYSHVLVDNHEDVIVYGERNDMPYGEIRIVLESAPRVTWWKGAEVSHAFIGIVGSTFTQDWNHGPNSTVIRVDAYRYNPSLLAIKLLKAKMFGIHTGMYCIFNLSAKRGKTLHFYWSWDDTFPRGTGTSVQP
jgi:hypothetical protein